jgi:hypothetical protein
VGTSNAFMLWIFYLTLYLPYDLPLSYYPNIIQVLWHCCIFPRSKDHIWGRTYNFIFWVCLTLFRMMYSSSIHLLANDKISFLWMSKILLCINTTFSWSIHLSWGILVISITWLLWIALKIHGCSGAFGITCVTFIQVYPQEWDCWIIWQIYI